jgi:hypothetical protein
MRVPMRLRFEGFAPRALGQMDRHRNRFSFVTLCMLIAALLNRHKCRIWAEQVML